MPIVSPSLLSADFFRAQRRKIQSIPNADWLHVDVMDGRFVPNITIGPLVVKAIRACSDKPLDVHLMIVEPDKRISKISEMREPISLPFMQKPARISEAFKNSFHRCQSRCCAQSTHARTCFGICAGPA